MTRDASELLERELFALRARAIETPALDLDDVIARAERPQRMTGCSRVTTWIGAAACAAASWMAVSVHEPPRADEASLASTSMSYFDGLSCRADLPDALPQSDPGMCLAPNQLVCDVTLASSKP